MKKALGIILSGLMLMQVCVAPANTSDAVSAYYDDVPTITGESSRTVTKIYDGVTRTDYVLAPDTLYRRQAFSTVEFDPKQDDLYLEVRCGTDNYNNLRTTSATVANYNSTNGEGKTALAAVNGDMWLMNNYHSRVLGRESSYVSGYKYPANVSKSGLTIPRGFSMYGGEIICTTHMVQEVPYEGTFQSFGISSDGTPLLGNIIASISVRNDTRGVVVSADGINRLPADGALVMYTDKGHASNYSLSDAYEVIIDFDYDYTVKHGETITGTVTAITKPNGVRQNMQANRVILTARGDRISRLSSFQIGDTVKITVSVRDEYGNTDKWRTVTDCVGGHMPIVINGVSQNLGDSTNYPASILGIKENGNVVLLTSWGRKGSTYSYGLFIYQLDEICAELGIVTAFLLDGGGSATMVCETRPGAYELTGIPCDSGDTERAVVNSVILAVGPSKSGIDSTDITFASGAGALVREPENVTYTNDGGILTLCASGFKNPNFKLDLFGGISADTYKYMVIEASPTGTDGGDFTLGVYPAAGDTCDPVITKGTKLTFDCDGTWQRKLVNLSGTGEWRGRMNFIRFDLFDDTGIGITGEGIKISKVRFFKDKSAAERYLSATDPGDFIIGDANGDGEIDLIDAVLMLRYIAGWDVAINTAAADFDRNGAVEVPDVTALLRALAS